MDRFALSDSLRLREGVTSARWDQADAGWCVTTAAGRQERFDVLIPATGQLSRPYTPPLPGLDKFERSVFHSARCNWIIPRGDKAVTQEERWLFMTRPETAMKLYAMQRELIFEAADNYAWQAVAWTPKGRAAFERIARDHLEAQFPDPSLREKLTPDFPIGRKRIIFSDDFYPALTQAHVALGP